MVQQGQTPRRVKIRQRGRKLRRDAGSKRFKARDGDVLRFGAEQTFARYDTLGEYLAPGYRRAIALPPPEQLADPTPPAKRDWPADLRHRLMAVSRLMRKLEERGHVEIIQPWADQPAWFRVTGQGLRCLGLDWPEIFFPEEYEDLEGRLRHDRYFHSHHHLINQVRLLLARGEADAPGHIWKGERALEAHLPPREKGIHRPHKPDGILGLLEDGAWPLTSVSTQEVVGHVEMKANQIIAVEVECSLKSDDRLRKTLRSLLEHHDFAWYFCLTPEIRKAVAKARKEEFSSDEQRRRVRLLKLEDFFP